MSVPHDGPDDYEDDFDNNGEEQPEDDDLSGSDGSRKFDRNGFDQDGFDRDWNFGIRGVDY
jgi:hypothetical protein